MLILGGHGCGNDVLAKRFSKTWLIKDYDMDLLFGLIEKSKDEHDDEAKGMMYEQIMSEKSWIIHGPYGKWAQYVIPRVTILVFLDVSSIYTVTNLEKKGPEFDKWFDVDMARVDYEHQLKLAKDYHDVEKQQGDICHVSHLNVFEKFEGRKYHFKSFKEVEDWFKSEIQISCT